MASKRFAAFALVSAILLVYLFVSAPAPLAEAETSNQETISVKELLEICAAENAVVRKLYTKEIVGPGKAAGLKFDERWQKDGVDAGPLPALFLRETAKSLERDPVRLGLFLGSDFPISKANLFKGRQAEMFRAIRADRKPRHFFVDDIGLYTAMFPDLAVAPACVDCHNEHPDTPKKNWKLDDVMGATTWTYPNASLSVDEALAVVAALRRAFSDAYGGYVEKTKTFANPPKIGDSWPAQGYFLPSPREFMREATTRTSRTTLARLLAER